MPIHQGRDRTGSYYRWGNRGKKYYFPPSCLACRSRARAQAGRQAAAAFANGYRGR